MIEKFPVAMPLLTVASNVTVVVLPGFMLAMV